MVKRRIARFALKSRRGTHTHIGQGGPKALHRQIDRRVDYGRSHSSLTFVTLICDDPSQSRTRYPPKEKSKSWRMSWHVFRPHFIWAFLLSCITGPPRGVDPYLVNQICDDYDHARNHFEDVNEGMEDFFQSRIEVLRQRLETNRSGVPWTTNNLRIRFDEEKRHKYERLKEERQKEERQKEERQ